MNEYIFEKEMLDLFHQLTNEEKVNYLFYLQCLIASQPDVSSVLE